MSQGGYYLRHLGGVQFDQFSFDGYADTRIDAQQVANREVCLIEIHTSDDRYIETVKPNVTEVTAEVYEGPFSDDEGKARVKAQISINDRVWDGHLLATTQGWFPVGFEIDGFTEDGTKMLVTEFGQCVEEYLNARLTGTHWSCKLTG